MSAWSNFWSRHFPNGLFVTAESEAAIAAQSSRLTTMSSIIDPVQHSPPTQGYGQGNQKRGGLFMGAVYTVTNQTDIFANNVGAVINCTHDLQAYPSYFSAQNNLKSNLGVTFARLTWADSPDQKLDANDIKGAVTFIHEKRSQGVSVLVHCVMGVSRSATLVTAYLVASTKKSVEECIADLKTKREEANPNDNFVGQLKEFEAELLALELKDLTAESSPK
jgi:protein-tyrosine phosphatase